ncbi:MAG: hypothetical protein HC904_14375 [Blastochloris sp.]|nr:hypothetical protein [Blastochloris sp.]
MIGRGAIRNPWIFRQIEELQRHGTVQTQPSLRDLRAYIEVLYRDTMPASLPEKNPGGQDEKIHELHRPKNRSPGSFPPRNPPLRKRVRLFQTCDRYLNSDLPFEAETPGGFLQNAGNPRTDCY